MRNGTIQPVTGETDVRLGHNLDGRGRCQASTGVLFLNHTLHPISSHGLPDLEISATGNPHIDDLHRHEDGGIAIGPCVGPLDDGTRRNLLRPAG
jgi:imidazoleglycerol-phosphate dehydratase